MVISELFSKTYNLVKSNLILVQPVLIFFLILSLITSPVKISGGLNIAVIIMIISIAGLFCAFCAGWYCMFHKSIQDIDKLNLSPEEKALNSISPYKEFFPGVGKYFLKMLLGFILYAAFVYILLTVIHFAGAKFIGFPNGINPEQLFGASANEKTVMDIINKISPADKIKIIKWDLMVFLTMSVFSYLTMFWTQAVITEGRRPFRAYWESIKAVFKRPLTTISIYFAQSFSIFALSIISASASMNIIVQFILLVGLIHIVVYFTMVSFLYYEKYR